MLRKYLIIERSHTIIEATKEALGIYDFTIHGFLNLQYYAYIDKIMCITFLNIYNSEDEWKKQKYVFSFILS